MQDFISKKFIIPSFFFSDFHVPAPITNEKWILSDELFFLPPFNLKIDQSLATRKKSISLTQRITIMVEEKRVDNHLLLRRYCNFHIGVKDVIFTNCKLLYN